MYIDRNILEEYPFTGQFYTSSDNMPDDGDMLGISDDGDMLSGDDDADTDTDNTEDENGEINVVLETSCDIQNTSKVFASDTSGSYLDIYFPFDTAEGIDVRIGHRFRSENWYRPVDGRVYAVVPSPMGGCLAQIREVGVNLTSKD